MADDSTVSKQLAPFEEHALYQAAMRQLDKGNPEGAAAKLRRLKRHFPRDQALQDLLVRIELRASLASAEPAASQHRAPSPLLRQVVLVMMTLTLLVAIVVGFAAAYSRLVVPDQEEREATSRLDALKEEGQDRLEAGDWAGARAVWQDVLSSDPMDATAQAGLDETHELEELDRLYAEALAAEERGDWQAALNALRQIEAQRATYRDVPQRIAAAQKQQQLETRLQEAQGLIQAEDWAAAAAILAEIRRQNPGFRQSDVEQQLFQAYVQLARQKIRQANGDPNLLREALEYLDKALALRPTDRDLAQERRLAAEFVAGAEAYASQNWVEAADHWDFIYTTRPDYQDAILRDPLREVYPKAARALIAQAGGATRDLRQAITYLDRALALSPGEADLIEERRLAAGYVDGGEAYSMGQWNQAIDHWGPIYAVRPGYQNGMLEERLRQACSRVTNPDPNLCPP